MQKNTFKTILSLSFFLSFATQAVAANIVSSSEARNHVGKNITVCGKAVQIAKVGRSTFINLDKPHPGKDFYFYYRGADFPSSTYQNKEVCGKGTIVMHKGTPQIIIKNPGEIYLKPSL